MAPEVIACEINKDDPYDAKADVWSAGITLIELAEMHPPHHEMNPCRVLMRISKTDPPTLSNKKKWSESFHQFLSRCLIKNPKSRSTAKMLMEHSFLNVIDSHQPLVALYKEVHADVVETLEPLPVNEGGDKEDSESTTTGDSGSLAGDIGPEVKAIPSGDAWIEEVDGKPNTPPDTPSKKQESKSRHASTGSEGWRYQTVSRVRTFEVDGQVITSTIRRVVDPRDRKWTKTGSSSCKGRKICVKFDFFRDKSRKIAKCLLSR